MHNRLQKINSVISNVKKGKQFIDSIYASGIRSPQTWYRWEKNNPRLKFLRDAATKICDDKRNTVVIDSLFKKAVGGDTGAIAIWLKYKMGWKDSPLINASQYNHFTKIEKIQIPIVFENQQDWENFVVRFNTNKKADNNVDLPGF